MRRGPATILVGLFVLVVALLIVHIGVGSYVWYSPGKIFAEILRGPGQDQASVIVWQDRLPRGLACMFVGMLLGMVGSAFQAQFRNPLADPYIVGVSSGAAIGGVLGLIVRAQALFGVLTKTVFGFVGGLLALGLVVGLARKRGVIDVTSLLLAGVVTGSLLSSVLSLALLWSGEDSNRVLDWLLGSTKNVFWPQIAVLAVVTVVGAGLLIRETRRLNALALGEEAAKRLGVDADRLRTVILTVGTAMTAAAVGVVGIIGFLGLVAPHIARSILGVDWRWSLVGAGLVGAILMIAADLVAQRGLSLATGMPGMEIPVGIVTAIIGAPSLLILLRRQP